MTSLSIVRFRSSLVQFDHVKSDVSY